MDHEEVEIDGRTDRDRHARRRGLSQDGHTQRWRITVTLHAGLAGRMTGMQLSYD